MSICSRLQLWLYCFLIGVVAILFSTSAIKPPAMPPGWINSDANSTPGAPRVTLLDSTAKEVLLRFDFPGLQASRVQTARGAYTRLSGESQGHGGVPGLPDLPVLRREVEIPWGAQVSLELVSSKYREVDLSALGFRERVLPLQPPTPKCGDVTGPIGCNESVYSKEAYYPESPVRLGIESELRGHRILTIEIWPALYQPVAGRLRLYSSLELRLSFSQASLQAANPPNLRPASPVFESILAERLVNYTPAAAIQMSVPPQYLIISADLFASHLAPFIALKQAQGFAVTTAMLSKTGVTQTDIKAYIKSRYQGPTPPDYLLLVGDDNFLATSEVSTGIRTDWYYTIMGAPPDYTSDILYGRLPVRNTADLDAWVAKMLSYDKASGNESWAKGAAFLATNDNNFLIPPGLPAYQLVENTHNAMIDLYTAPLGFSGSFPFAPQAGGDRLYAHTNQATQANVVSVVNEGRALVIYSGHGIGTEWQNPRFTREDVRAITGPPATLALGFACNTSDFELFESLGDTWVTRASSGALAYIGATTSVSWLEDYEFEKSLFNNLFNQNDLSASLAAALQTSLYDIRLYSDLTMHYPEIYQLFGDPSLQIIRKPKLVDFSIDLSPAHLGVCTGGHAEGSIAVRGQYDFNQPVNLSIPGLPAGLSAFFSQNPLSPGDIGSFTLNSIVSAPFDLPMTVIGTSGDLTRESRLVFSVHASPPLEVTLLEPAPFTPNTPLRPTLIWSAPPEALSYDLQIASDHLFSNRVVDVSSLTQPQFTPEVELTPGRTYWWRVRAVNACGSSAFSLPERFTTLPQPGTCSPDSQRTVISTTDFEDDTSGWNFSTYGPWELKNTYSHSPSLSAFARSNLTYPGVRSMVSPAIPLPGSEHSPIELTFWSKHIFENQMECKDGGLLDLSIDNGMYWTPLAPEQITLIPYDGLIGSNHQNPLGNQFGWCGTRDWSKVVVSLVDYAGKTVKLRWRLGTDVSIGEGDGWYVDDVSVESCLYPAAPAVLLNPSESQITGLAGETIVHTLELTNGGSQPVAFDLSAAGGSWAAQVDPAHVLLEADVSAPVTVRVLIPAAAAPGISDQASLIVTASEDHALHAQAALKTMVSSYRIELGADQPYQLGFPDRPVTFNILVTNAGIEEDNISLSFAQSPDGWIVGPLESPFSLAAGASKLILATVFVPGGAPAGTLANFTLEAVSQGNPAVKAQLALQVQVEGQIPLYLPLIIR